MKFLRNNGEIFEGEYDIQIARHTSSHILAQAVKRLYPDSKLAIGPAIDTGFYYDFDNLSIKQEDLEKVENEMKKIIKENLKIETFELSKEEALKWAKENGEIYKEELISEIAENDRITFFKQGDFTDLCVGPHMLYTKGVGKVKLISVTGAYWRGNENNKMLTRIYGTAFKTQEEVDEYIKQREEAKEKDHNKLGRELGLFTTVDVVGQGLPLLMPKGARVMQILQRFVEDVEEKHGYLLTKTPFMAKSDLYKLSGHWDHYKDGMFVLGDESKDKEVMALRPMTCPFQFMIYKNNMHSYKELPFRYDETSTLFRNEASGEMHGLTRVRQFTLSEGHLVVRPDQVEEEFKGVLNLIKYFMRVLDIEDELTYRFSKYDPNDKSGKYIDNKEAWEFAQDKMKKILDHLNIDYVEAEGEAAFYGPKLDIQGKNVYGKEDTIITIQLDFFLPESLDMTYIDKDGSKKRPVVIHRSAIGSYERTLAMLIEKYAGAFPLWLSPIQIKILPISENEVDYANKIKEELMKENLRVEVDYSDEKIGYKIRQAQLEKVPYMFVIGKNEVENNTVSIRARDGKKQDNISLQEVITNLKEEIKTALDK